jgi:hypothetical protein
LCFHELIKETDIDGNRVGPNLQILIERGLVKKYRNEHKMMYQVSDKDRGNDYLWNQFMRFAGVKDKGQRLDPTTIAQPKPSSNWKTLQEETDFVVDKKGGS